MNLNNFKLLRFLAVAVLLTSSCNSNKSSDNAPSTSAPAVAGLTNGATLQTITGANVVQFTVNGSTCSAGSYSNKPCVSVKICNPGSTSACVTVNDILLDTGSYGLRVFQSALPGLTLTPVLSHQGGNLATCAQFGVDAADATALWGPVETADVYLGGEAAVTIPIQVINASYATVPASCENPYQTPYTPPSEAGFNGILGVGLAAEDCGSDCVWQSLAVPNTDNGVYFSCSGSTCSGGSTNSLANQVQNPVGAQATDNNGLLIELPSIISTGTSGVSGYMILGIGTKSNNQPGSVNLYETDAYGNIATTFQGSTVDGFLDTGSNGLLFSANLATDSQNWYVPNSVVNYSATNQGSQTGATASKIYFDIADADTLFSTDSVFNDLGGYVDPSVYVFDFGLPFFFGRNIYIGIDGKSVPSLGSGVTGPLWAY